MPTIVAEAPGYLQVFSDGSTKRFPPETAPASTQPSNGYISKDVTIDPSKPPVTARIFLPISTAKKLPVTVYFHGGGFCIGSTTWLGYHHFLGDLSVVSQTIVLSVDYRLAPESRLPVAYDDCYSSLEWLSQRSGISGSEPCLEQADLSRVFLSGDSAGGNIAHQVALRAMRDKSCCVNIRAVLLIHPYFGSERRTERELREGSEAEVAMNDMFWRLSVPEGAGRDYYGCNYETEGVAETVWARFPAVEVYVAGIDFLKERGVMYSEFLRRKGVRDVAVVEAEGQPHVYHVFDPKSRETLLLQRRMTEFIKSRC